MRREPWDLFLVCFMAAHRGGHQLWDPSRTLDGGSAAELEQARIALKQVYIACDAALGRLVEEAGPEAVTLAFAVHGMGPNLSRTDLLREMLARILHGSHGGAPAGYARFARRLRDLVPLRWRGSVKASLPQPIQDRLTLFWRSGGTDWRSTRAFTVFGDQEGYVRLNLQGREAQGIVSLDECEELMRGIEEGAAQLRGRGHGRAAGHRGQAERGGLWRRADAPAAAGPPGVLVAAPGGGAPPDRLATPRRHPVADPRAAPAGAERQPPPGRVPDRRRRPGARGGGY
jgi:predicted AlkP superfamily phosphohydrolase/phosphomutase